MATNNCLHVLLYLWLSFITVSRFIPTLAETESDNYVIHMDLSAMPKAFSSQHNWYLATLASAIDKSDASVATSTKTVSSKLIYSYTHVVNGFSAHLTPSELETLKNTPGFVSAIRDLPVKHDTTRTPQFLGLNSQSGAWKISNYGEGTIIGLVDTGIWPESESYKDDGMPEVPERWKGECEIGAQFNSSLCNKKLIGARYFNKGLIAKKPNITVSMNSTRDTVGHGTHTSSTAAGNFVEGASFFGYAPGTASGMAPKAHVAMYKALWDEGSQASDIIAAIDQAVDDGVDVLSMSFGRDVPMYEDPIAIATFAAVEKNLFVSTSAGNEGSLATLHNGTPWILTVAAGTLDREFGGVLELGNGDSVPGMSLYVGNFTSNKVRMVFMDACLNITELNAVGEKVVVCQDKNDSIAEQAYNVGRANVSGGIFITNAIIFISELIQSSYPAIFISPKEGETILHYINSTKEPEGIMEFRRTTLGVKQAPMVASYSSRGPSPSCPFVMKPDIMAPGDLVLAAWPPNVEVTQVNAKPQFSNFNLLSGTSMACPHAAGVAALLKKSHPEWTPAAIRSAMMTTADTMDHVPEPIRDMGEDTLPIANPLAMGAGQVNPNRALDPGLIYDLNKTDYVRLICAMNFTEKQVKTITGSSTTDCSNPSLDLNYPSFIAFFNADNSSSNLTTIQEFHRTVTNVGPAMSTYTADVTALNGLKVTVIPGQLVFKTQNEKLSYRLVLEGPGKLQDLVTFGYLSWIDDGGKHVVKSPIVATRLSLETITK